MVFVGFLQLQECSTREKSFIPVFFSQTSLLRKSLGVKGQTNPVQNILQNNPTCPPLQGGTKYCHLYLLKNFILNKDDDLLNRRREIIGKLCRHTNR